MDVNSAPLYPTTTGSAKVTEPTVLSDAAVSVGRATGVPHKLLSLHSSSYPQCQADPYSFDGNLEVRAEHPLLMAPAYKWDCLMNQSESQRRR